MDTIKQWAVCLCSAVLAAGIIMMLAPEGGTKKILKTVVSIFVLCGIIAPAANLSGIHFSVSDKPQEAAQVNADSLQAAVNQQILTASEENIKKITIDALIAGGINPKTVFVNMDIAEDNSIIINQLDIVLDNAQNQQEAEHIINKTMGLECRISVQESEEAENEGFVKSESNE